jgi:glutathione S-transferase
VRFAVRLYHHPFSSSARRAVMAALHMNTDVELVLVQDLRDPEQRRELLLLNPNGKIPVLQDGDLVLWESYAIMQYFADKSPGQTLYPVDLKARADVNRWMYWCAQHWTPAVGVLVWENWMKPLFGNGAPADRNEVRRGEAELAKVATVLDGHLRGREWLCPSGLSLADFAISVTLAAQDTARLPLLQYGNLQAWFGRVQSLDVWKKTKLEGGGGV